MTSCVQPFPNAKSGLMPNPYHHAADVLRFASNTECAFALVIVTAVTGGAMRARGALMCVGEDSRVAGYISNGCVDADIIFQAQAAIKTGVATRLVYGEGSPFKDIELPCGGRIDVLIVPSPAEDMIFNAADGLANRQSVRLKLEGETFAYNPKLRIRVAGRGEAVKALVRQGIKTGFDVSLQSPEDEMAKDLDVDFDHLKNPGRPMPNEDDPWTAVVLMFHDHDWEPAILAQALNGPAFYIGAMGSPRTHEHRTATLQANGISLADINRIHGPIGLVPSMRDANLLALSTLAEIVSVAQEKRRL